MTNRHECPCCHMDFDWNMWIDGNNYDETVVAFNKAAAADAMYEALKRLCELTRQTFPSPPDLHSAWDKAQAALALADGNKEVG